MRGISRCARAVLAFGLAFMLALLAGCGASKSAGGGQGGAAGGKVELKLAYHLPVDHHLSKSVERFAQKVNEKSKGSVTVTTYPAGQLYTDKSMNDAIMSGGLDMGLNSTAMWTTVIPVLNVLDVPFLLPTYESVGRAIDGGLGKTLAAEMGKKGVVPLIWADYGYIQFCNNARPIKTPADFKGLQIRGYGQIPAETIKALGASPVTMGAAEVYTAIQRDEQGEARQPDAGAEEGAGGGGAGDPRRDPPGDEGRGRRFPEKAPGERHGGVRGAGFRPRALAGCHPEGPGGLHPG